MHALTIEGLDVDLRVVRFAGVEELSRPFWFEVTAVTHERDVVLRDAIGRPVLLTIDTGAAPRHVHGMVSRCEQGEHVEKATAFRFEIVPLAHRLTLRRVSRIFQELAVPDVVKKVLEGAGVPAAGFTMNLQVSYPPREYCVQYRETDWDFVSRLCEEEGITVYFEHSESGHSLVFVDSPSAHGPIPGDASLPFRPPSDALVSGEGVSNVRVAEALTSGKSTLRDYNFKKPQLVLEGTASASADDDLEVYDQPAEVDAPAEAQRLAKTRLEELGLGTRTARGDSNVSRFVPGSTFELAEHPREDVCGKYLLVRVEHTGHDPAMAVGAAAGTPYGNRFEALPEKVPFRPSRITPRPAIHGTHTAIVVGPSGEEIHVDQHGRIKVQFHWDREGKKDDKSSCWIRVAQAWAGAAFGAMFIPRIGHEVVITFLEGDPDRPLAIGSVYHGTNVPPYALPADKTKSTIKSQSSPGGGGFNELRFEDRKGQEEVFLHAQKDWLIQVLNDKNQTIGHDESAEVGHDRKRKVAANETIEVGASRSLTVGVNETDKIGANLTAEVGANASLTVGANVSITLGGAFSQAVGKGMTLSVAEDKEESVGKSSTESVAENKSVTVKGNLTTDVEKALSTHVAKDASTDVEGSISITAGKSYVLECGDGKITVQKNGDVTIEGKKIVIKGSGPIEVEGSKLKVKSEGSVDVNASGTVQVKGSAVNVN